MLSLRVNILRTVLSFSVLFFLSTNTCLAQEFNLNNLESSLTVLGTSSLHDWHVVAEKQNGKIIFKDLENGNINTCTFEVISESLKSGKSSMDKNTYKALKTEKYKTINFSLVEVNEIVKKSNTKFFMKSVGDLTISGVKKRIPIEFNVEISATRVTLSGEKKIKMTDFNIEPPKALFGTITTGDDITIKFTTTFK